MYCPACRSEYRTGITRCVQCAVDLVDVLPEERPLGIEGVEAAVAEGTALAVAKGPLQTVNGMRDVLASSRIPTVVRADPESQDPTTGVATLFDVLVHPDDGEAAAGALAADFQGLITGSGLDAGGGEVVDLDAGGEITCPACGTVFKGQECPDCGLFLGIPDEG